MTSYIFWRATREPGPAVGRGRPVLLSDQSFYVARAPGPVIERAVNVVLSFLSRAGRREWVYPPARDYLFRRDTSSYFKPSKYRLFIILANILLLLSIRHHTPSQTYTGSSPTSSIITFKTLNQLIYFRTILHKLRKLIHYYVN